MGINKINGQDIHCKSGNMVNMVHVLQKKISFRPDFQKIKAGVYSEIE